jgi:hypothetical protein
MISGVHKITAEGTLIAQNGKARFRLHEARFDENTLPNFLVEPIISAVGRRQTPPFDPLEPSEMPYHIDKVDLHHGYIVVYQ